MGRRGGTGKARQYAAKRERALALVQRGRHTNLEIAADLGVYRKTVDGWVRDAGLRPLGWRGARRRRRLNPTAADLERERERARRNQARAERERLDRERAWNAEREPLRKEAARLWRAGENQKAIAATLGVSPNKVNNLLAEFGIDDPGWRERLAQRGQLAERQNEARRKQRLKAAAEAERRRAEGVRRGRAGERVATIAADLGVTRDAVYQWLRDAGSPRGTRHGPKTIPLAVRKVEAAARYAAGQTVARIGQELCISSSTICVAVLQAGGKLRGRGYQRPQASRPRRTGKPRAVRAMLPADVAFAVTALAGSFGRSVEEQMVELLRAGVAPIINNATAEASGSEEVTLRATDGVDLQQVAENLERRGVPFRWLDGETLAWLETAA